MAKISLHALSIFKKVYYRVSRDKLWKVLREYGIDGHFWSVATRHFILMPTGSLCSSKWQAIKAVQCGPWTPARVRFVTSHFRCLHELN